MRKKSFQNDDCPIARALEIVGDWWSLLIVRDAMVGRRRFGEFAQGLGLAKNILASRLKKLVAFGILTTAPASDGTAYNEYVLTPKGIDLFYILVALRQWSDRWVEGTEEFPEVLVDARDGEPVAPLELHARDGRLLSIYDVRLERRKPRKTKKAS